MIRNSAACAIPFESNVLIGKSSSPDMHMDDTLRASADLSILIVESYAPNVRLLAELTRHVGLSAVCVPDLASATAQLTNRAVAAVILSSFGSHAVAASWTRAFRFGTAPARRCPVFALSDCTRPGDLALLRGAGVSDVIATPISIDAYFDAIDAYLVPELDRDRARAASRQLGGPAQPQLRFA